MAKIMGVIITADHTVNCVVDGTPYTVQNSHPNFAAIKEALKNKDGDAFLVAYKSVPSVKQYVEQVKDNRVTVQGDTVYFNGKVVHNVLADRIIEMMNDGEDFSGMVKFLENHEQNPSFKCRQNDYNFLQHKNLPITDDGCFLAYKTVRSDWMDKYSGTIFNGVGTVVECERADVDDESSHHCSHGLHVGALSYAGPGGWYNSWEDHVVIVKVNPRDIVSVPTDHNFTKMRVCRYEVLCEYKAPLERSVYAGNSPSVYDQPTSCRNDDDLFDDDDEDDYDDDADTDYIEAEDMLAGYQYCLRYYKQAEGWHTRYVFVEHTYDDRVEVSLSMNDPHFESGVPQYRTMLFDNMECIQLLN